MPNSGGFSRPSDNNAAIIQTSKAAFFRVFSLRSPPGPGDDIQLAAALDPSEQPLPVPAAYGNVEPGDAAELTAARYWEGLRLRLAWWEAAPAARWGAGGREGARRGQCWLRNCRHSSWGDVCLAQAVSKGFAESVAGVAFV